MRTSDGIARHGVQGLTIGATRGTAAIYEHEGRFHARAMQLRFDLDDELGRYWGPWQLEQHPDDSSLLRGEHDGEIRRHQALRAIVDGGVVFDAASIPVDTRS